MSSHTPHDPWTAQLAELAQGVPKAFFRFRDLVARSEDVLVLAGEYNSIAADVRGMRRVDLDDLHDDLSIDAAFRAYQVVEDLLTGDASGMYYHAGARLLECAAAELFDFDQTEQLLDLQSQLADALGRDERVSEQRLHGIESMWRKLVGHSVDGLPSLVVVAHNASDAIEDDGTWAQLADELVRGLLAPLWITIAPVVGNVTRPGKDAAHHCDDQLGRVSHLLVEITDAADADGLASGYLDAADLMSRRIEGIARRAEVAIDAVLDGDALGQDHFEASTFQTELLQRDAVAMEAQYPGRPMLARTVAG